MTERHADQLREAFETHENQTPDPAAVYARVQELSQKYRRRRRGAQVAGCAVLSAGLVAGAINLPAMLAGPAVGAGTPGLQAGEAPQAPAVSASPSIDLSASALDAYFQAGYDYDDALRLAVLWNKKADALAIKTEAGRRLLAGEQLPFPATPDEPPPSPDSQEQKQIEAYFDAGYVFEDAVELAKIWKLEDPYEAKALAGQKLLDGKKLPIKPQPENVAAAKQAAQVEAFFEAGYDYDDAVKLAKLWKLKDAYAAKVAGGKKLLSGGSLPFEP